MAARKAGSIVSKGRNKYLIRWFLGRGPDGKRRYASKTLIGTYRVGPRFWVPHSLGSLQAGGQAACARHPVSSRAGSVCLSNSEPRCPASAASSSPTTSRPLYSR